MERAGADHPNTQTHPRRPPPPPSPLSPLSLFSRPLLRRSFQTYAARICCVEVKTGASSLEGRGVGVLGERKRRARAKEGWKEGGEGREGREERRGGRDGSHDWMIICERKGLHRGKRCQERISMEGQDGPMGE